MSAGASSKQGGSGGGVAASSDDAHGDLPHPAQARARAVSQGAWSGTMGGCDSSEDERTAAFPHSPRSGSKSKGRGVSRSAGQRGTIRKGGVASGTSQSASPPRRAGGLRTAEENDGESDSDASIGYPEQGNDSDSDASIGYPVARTGRDEAEAPRCHFVNSFLAQAAHAPNKGEPRIQTMVRCQSCVTHFSAVYPCATNRQKVWAQRAKLHLQADISVQKELCWANAVHYVPICTLQMGTVS